MVTKQTEMSERDASSKGTTEHALCEAGTTCPNPT